MTNPCVRNLNDIPICILQWWLPTVMSPLPWQPSPLTAACVDSVPRWQRPTLTASRVDCVPRWVRLALSASRVARPIQKRALGVPSARVKFLVTRRAKKRPLFLEKGKLEKNIVFWRLKTLSCVQMYDSHISLRVFDETCQIEENLLFFHFCSLCSPTVPTSPGFTPPLQKDTNPPLLKKDQSPPQTHTHTHTHTQTHRQKSYDHCNTSNVALLLIFRHFLLSTSPNLPRKRFS